MNRAVDSSSWHRQIVHREPYLAFSALRCRKKKSRELRNRLAKHVRYFYEIMRQFREGATWEMNYRRKYEEKLFVFDFDKLTSASVCVHDISLAHIVFYLNLRKLIKLKVKAWHNIIEFNYSSEHKFNCVIYCETHFKF